MVFSISTQVHTHQTVLTLPTNVAVFLLTISREVKRAAGQPSQLKPERNGITYGRGTAVTVVGAWPRFSDGRIALGAPPSAFKRGWEMMTRL